MKCFLVAQVNRDLKLETENTVEELVGCKEQEKDWKNWVYVIHLTNIALFSSVSSLLEVIRNNWIDIIRIQEHQVIAPKR